MSQGKFRRYSTFYSNLFWSYYALFRLLSTTYVYVYQKIHLKKERKLIKAAIFWNSFSKT